jgi:serine/threonine protein kinase
VTKQFVNVIVVKVKNPRCGPVFKEMVVYVNQEDIELSNKNAVYLLDYYLHPEVVKVEIPTKYTSLENKEVSFNLTNVDVLAHSPTTVVYTFEPSENRITMCKMVNDVNFLETELHAYSFLQDTPGVCKLLGVSRPNCLFLKHHGIPLNRIGGGLLSHQVFGKFVDIIQSIHQKGIIHRDIRPDNLLLLGETPYIIDFGLAIQTGHTDSKLIISPLFSPQTHYLKGNHIFNESTDLQSFVKTWICVALSENARFPLIVSARNAEENGDCTKLESNWKELLPTFPCFVHTMKAAEETNYDELKKIILNSFFFISMFDVI